MNYGKKDNIDFYEKIYIKSLYHHKKLMMSEKMKSTESFDKYLLTFATGSLYLSVFFTQELNNVEKSNVLIWGWILLIISILFILVSFLLSEKAFKKEIEETDKEIEDSEYKREENNKWSTFITIFQWISLITFIVGSASFIIFYFINIT